MLLKNLQVRLECTCRLLRGVHVPLAEQRTCGAVMHIPGPVDALLYWGADSFDDAVNTSSGSGADRVWDIVEADDTCNNTLSLCAPLINPPVVVLFILEELLLLLSLLLPSLWPFLSRLVCEKYTPPASLTRFSSATTDSHRKISTVVF
jgi:hypothetical protein